MLMASAWQIEVTDEFLYVRMPGPYGGVDETAAGMAAIAEQCRAARRWRVLIDVAALSSPIPQVDRFVLGTRAARAWGQRLKVAILAHPEHINHFFENVAINNGANV